MAKLSRTWWGQRFIEALTDIMDEGRLGRGRSYRSPNRIQKFEIVENSIKASVRGNANPYYGVYEVPTYKITIEMQTIALRDWKRLLQKLGSNAAWVTRLLMDEIPDEAVSFFSAEGYPLLPESSDDFFTECSCPDYSNPCKHIAGVYYRVASMLDEDPFLIFELRGMPRAKLKQELRQTPLGQALESKLSQESSGPIQPAAQRFSQPEVEPLQPISFNDFWALPAGFSELECLPAPEGIPGLLVKKQGDHPAFWKNDHSFIETMESIYNLVKRKNKESL